MSYFKLGSMFKGITTTATAGATTTLTNSSKQLQQFTGTSTQTVVLPDATTLVTTATQATTPRRFDFFNRSTGIVTVNANGGSLVMTVPAGSQQYVVLTNGSTAAGTWAVGGVTSAGGSAGVSTSDKFNLLKGMSSINASTDNIESRIVKFNPEEVSGNYWIIKTPVSTISNFGGAATLNGFAYIVGGLDNSTVNQTTNVRFNDDQNYWLSRQAIAVAANLASVAISNGLMMRIGGTGGSPSTDTEAYSDSTNTWSSKASLNTARRAGAYDTLDSGLVLVAGGTASTGNTVEVYSSSANAWYNRSGFTYSTTSNGQKGNTYNSNFYINGGFTGSVFVTSVSKYSEVLNSWTTPSALPEERQEMRGCVANGFNYYPGGVNNSAFVTTVYEYTDLTDTYRTAASISSARVPWNHSAINGQNVVLGGGQYSPLVDNPIVEQYKNSSFINLGLLKRTNTTPTSIFVSTLTNDLTSILPVQIRSDGDSWKNLTSGLDTALKNGESLSAKFTEYGLMYAAGGDFSSGAVTNNESYNDIQNVWTTRQSLTTALTGIAGFRLGGLGYLAGGSNFSIATVVNTIYSFSDLTNAFTTKSGVLTLSRRSQTGGVALNGFGYICGGLTSSVAATGVVDKYNASSDSCSAVASFSLAKQGAAINLNGRIYSMTGETQDSGTALTGDNQRYDDVLNTWTTVAAATAKAYAGAFALNGFGYVGDGYSGGVTQTSFKYNPSTDSWSSSASTPATNYEVFGARMGGFGYIVGNYTGASNIAAKFNDAASTYTATANLNGATYREGMAGGDFSPGSFHQWEVRVGIPAYYPGVGGGVWTTGVNIPVAGNANASYILDGRRFFGSAQNAQFYRFDDPSNSWVRSVDRSSGSGSQAAFTLYGQGYNQVVASNTTIKFDAVTSIWSTVGSINQARNRMTSQQSALNGFGYIFGGSDAGATTHFNSLEQYSSSANTWTTKAGRNNNTSQVDYTILFALSNQMYTLAGENASTVNTCADLELYQDAANTFLTMANFPTGGVSQNAVMLINGEAYSVAGYNANNSYVSSVFKYNTSANSWTTMSSIPSTARALGGGASANWVLGGNNGSNFSLVDQYNTSIKNAVLGLALEVK